MEINLWAFSPSKPSALTLLPLPPFTDSNSNQHSTLAITMNSRGKFQQLFHFLHFHSSSGESEGMENNFHSSCNNFHSNCKQKRAPTRLVCGKARLEIR